MCHKLDARFFDRLAEMNPSEVAAKSLAKYDASSGVYRIVALNEEFEVNTKTREIRSVGENGRPVSVELGLAIIFYLMQCDGSEVSGKWISEKEIKGGIQFFRGPHTIPTAPIAATCADGFDSVKEAALKLGGSPIDMGDAAYVFKALPRAPIAVVLWRGDEEFPPECKILMDRTIENHLPLDVIFGLAIEIARRLTGKPLVH